MKYEVVASSVTVVPVGAVKVASPSDSVAGAVNVCRLVPGEPALSEYRLTTSDSPASTPATSASVTLPSSAAEFPVENPYA